MHAQTLAPRRSCALLVVRKHVVVAVGLVTGGDDHALHAADLPRRFEDVPGSFDVRLERPDRIAVRDPNDRLRREVENGVDLVLAVGAHQERQIGEIAADQADAIQRAAAGQVAQGHLVADQTHDLRAPGDEFGGQSRPEETGAAGDEDRASPPEIVGISGTGHRQPPNGPS